MSNNIDLKKGLDIPIKGSAKPVVSKTVVPDTVAIVPADFKGFTPRLLVKEGDRVLAGSPVLADKKHPEILITSPVSGTVKEVVRGDKRKLLEVRIGTDSVQEYMDFGCKRPESLSAEEVNADYQYKSDTQDRIEIDIQNVAIHTEVITPNLIKVTVTDKAGKPLHSGQLSFAYYASSDPKDLENNLSKPSHSSSTMLAVDGKKEQHIVVFIFDGDTGQKHFATATIDSKAFNIFTDDFKTFHEWDGKYVPGRGSSMATMPIN